METKKIIPGIQFYLSFGVLPSNPEASRMVHSKIDNMVRYASGMEGLVEYMELRNAIWDNIFKSVRVAQKFGYFKKED